MLEELLPLTGLVFDIRGNGGGNENVGRDVASAFMTSRGSTGRPDSGSALATPIWERRSSSPSVRPGRWTARGAHRPAERSAAEDFVLLMRALPHAVTVGDTTLGVGSNHLPRELANGWTYLIPRSQAATPDGFVYNWKVLPPVIAVPWSADEVAAGRDPYIEAALAELKRRALR